MRIKTYISKQDIRKILRIKVKTNKNSNIVIKFWFELFYL